MSFMEMQMLNRIKKLEEEIERLKRYLSLQDGIIFTDIPNK